LSVFLGAAGSVELTRSSIDDVLNSLVNTPDVNVGRNRFSFDFQEGMLLTGDQLEIKATDGGLLDFVADWPHPDGKWFINVDQVGAIGLYRGFDDAVDGEAPGRVELQAPSRDIPIEVRVRNAIGRCLGDVTSFELNTERLAVDVTELSDEFRQQVGTTMSGSGTVSCFFDYRNALCSRPDVELDYEPELAVYLHQLILRQQLGSQFHARFFLVGKGEGHDDDDQIWQEFDAIVTNVAVAFEPTQPVRSTIQFVTTGEIKLRVKTASNYLTQENDDLMRLEYNQGRYYLEVEQGE
jgi:hypothetical protein